MAEIIGLAVLFAVNILLTIILLWHSTHRVERAVSPILSGIGAVARGRPVSLSERVELSDINAELNRAGAKLQKKELARSEWINGISHDIRTPLSLILGYAGEIEDGAALPGETKAQAGMIRRQVEKLRRLIADLNLASRLEYSMQPLKKTLISPVELARRVMSYFINNDPDERFSMDFFAGAEAEKILIEGDNALLIRMLENLIQNSMGHNPVGCDIFIAVGTDGAVCTLKVEDTGGGVPGPLLTELNSAEASPGTRAADGEAAHGMGLKLVKQIVRVHKGNKNFANADPHGLAVTIGLPVHSRI